MHPIDPARREETGRRSQRRDTPSMLQGKLAVVVTIWLLMGACTLLAIVLSG